MVRLIDDGGGTGFGGGGGGAPPSGGGQPGTPTGGGGPIGGFPFGENGGVVASNNFLFVPAQNLSTGLAYIGIFDTTSFDDLVDGSSYSYRSEDVVLNRVPTVRRVVLIYRDLGPAILTVTLTGTDDLRQVRSASTIVQIGNIVPTGALITKFVDLQLTAFRPRLSLSRGAGGGPLSIVSATIIGEIEEITL